MGCVRNWADSFFYLFWTKMLTLCSDSLSPVMFGVQAMAGCTCVQAVKVSAIHLFISTLFLPICILY